MPRKYAKLKTRFCSQTGPFSRHFGNFHVPKRVTTGKNHCFLCFFLCLQCLSIPSGGGSLLEKCVFDPLFTFFWSHNGPFSTHLGIFHGPKRVTAGSKWIGFGFQPRSPRYGPFFVFGLFDTPAHVRPFLAIFWPFLGHIVELEGKKELLVMGPSRRTWNV